MLQWNTPALRWNSSTLGACADFTECFADPLCNDCWESRWELCDPALSGDMGPYATVEECARARTRAECFPVLCGTGTRICTDANAQIVNGQCQCKPGFNKIGGSGPDIRCARPGGGTPVPTPVPASSGKKSGGGGLALLGFSALAAIAAAIIGAKS